nr:IS30 family transposase [Thermosediminibacter oceani]
MVLTKEYTTSSRTFKHLTPYERGKICALLKEGFSPTQIAKKLYGKSISGRPYSIEKREEFGHWEIDTVLGKRSSDHVLLTLTERKTRYHLLFPLANKTAEAVDEA